MRADVKDRRSRQRWAYFVIALLLLGAALGVLLAGPSQRAQVSAIRQHSNTYLVVTRDVFAGVLSPWQARREEQGFRVIVRSWQEAPTPKEIRAWIEQETAKAGGDCRYILLVGDCAAPEEADAPWHIPSVEGPSGYAYEGEEGGAKPIVSDAPYGDIDGDGQVEVAVGRLPVRTVLQLEDQFTKMFEYEARPKGPSFYRAVLWTGGKHYQRSMYDITMQYAAHMLPNWVSPYILSSYRRSVCSGRLEEQPELFLSAISEPAFLSVVVSHGSYDNVRCAEKDGEEISLTVEHVNRLQSTSAVGPLMMLACEAGTFFLPSEKGPSLAEAFFLHPGGPVAVVASTGVVNPVTNLYMAAGIAENVKGSVEGQGGSETIGDLLVDSRRLLFEMGKYSLKELSTRDPRARKLSRSIAANAEELFETRSMIRNERLHYNLLGDPSLPLSRPLPLPLQVEQTGPNRMRLAGVAPPGAEFLWIEHVDLNRYRSRLPRRASDEERRRAFEEVNRPPSLLARQELDGNAWQVDVELDESQMGPGQKIRLMALGKSSSHYHTLTLPYQEP